MASWGPSKMISFLLRVQFYHRRVKLGIAFAYHEFRWKRWLAWIQNSSETEVSSHLLVTSLESLPAASSASVCFLKIFVLSNIIIILYDFLRRGMSEAMRFLSTPSSLRPRTVQDPFLERPRWHILLFKVIFCEIPPGMRWKTGKRTGKRSEPRKIWEYKCAKPIFWSIFYCFWIRACTMMGVEFLSLD